VPRHRLEAQSSRFSCCWQSIPAPQMAVFGSPCGIATTIWGMQTIVAWSVEQMAKWQNGERSGRAGHHANEKMTNRMYTKEQNGKTKMWRGVARRETRAMNTLERRRRLAPPAMLRTTRAGE